MKWDKQIPELVAIAASASYPAKSKPDLRPLLRS
jgi:hypothetical protein